MSWSSIPTAASTWGDAAGAATKSAWAGVSAPATADALESRQQQALQQILTALQGIPVVTQRDRAALTAKANEIATPILRALGISADVAQTLILQAVAQIGGLGFLNALLPPARNDLNEIVLNPDGGVWVLPKSGSGFLRLDMPLSTDAAWRAVEALLAPLGRTLTEASPSVGAKLPREQGFGGARVQAMHPVIVPGSRFPSVNIRLFEAKPVKPEQLLAWDALPEFVLHELLAAVANKCRVLICGGTATGKTTFLSALACGIPNDARIVKIEDPEEIYLEHAHVVTIEARPAILGSDVPEYTLRNGVDDAMRMSPKWLIVGEVRKGDAALALFRAQMSDHPGLSTFHAESAPHAAFRMAVIMKADAGVDLDASYAIFANAVDLVVQVGWRDKKRKIVGVWQVDGLQHGKVAFSTLWEYGQSTMKPITRQRH